MKLGAKKLPSPSSFFAEPVEKNGIGNNGFVKDRTADTPDTPGKHKKEMSISVCKECGKTLLCQDSIFDSVIILVFVRKRIVPIEQQF
ncbi:unnamed protein product [Cylicostephanus goldi]|uniref:Uncharacterized protein n=1 Tax=Cylicostephanus goldi TaxID=71465 RepID=A0A3P7P0P1_CYLGO|nr:unnamed protein product [Cylicostephanus goldi]